MLKRKYEEGNIQEASAHVGRWTKKPRVMPRSSLQTYNFFDNERAKIWKSICSSDSIETRAIPTNDDYIRDKSLSELRNGNEITKFIGRRWRQIDSERRPAYFGIENRYPERLDVDDSAESSDEDVIHPAEVGSMDVIESVPAQYDEFCGSEKEYEEGDVFFDCFEEELVGFVEQKAAAEVWFSRDILGHSVRDKAAWNNSAVLSSLLVLGTVLPSWLLFG